MPSDNLVVSVDGMEVARMQPVLDVASQDESAVARDQPFCVLDARSQGN